MRYFGADILTLLKKIATDDLNNMIDTIKTERGDSGLEKIRKINTGICERQYPECVINLQDSTNVSSELNLTIDDTSEEYPAEILIVMKDNTEKIDLRMEYYIEALQRIFHGYADDSISWIEFTSGIRADAYTEQRETLKIAGIKINVRIY